MMIGSFGNRLAEDVYDDRRTAAVRRLPPALYQAARRKVLYLHEAEELRDLRVPPGDKLEALKGNRAGWFSVRINDQWRVVFRWETGQALEVSIVDYH
jgi:proteic killer suppression protein